jgi:hypothetical protein
MPEFAPSDPLSALERVKYLSYGSIILILSIKSQVGSPWYEVRAYDKENEFIENGWINSQTLMYQELKFQNINFHN